MDCMLFQGSDMMKLMARTKPFLETCAELCCGILLLIGSQ